MLLLQWFEAHFHFRSNFDGVPALDRGLIAELGPRHNLAELCAGFKFSDLSVRVDDEFAARGAPFGLPKRCGQNCRTFNQ